MISLQNKLQPSFENLPSELSAHFNQIKSVRAVSKGSSILTQGFPVPGFFRAIDHRFKLSLIGNSGEEKIISISRPGELIAFVGPEAPFTVTALENSRIEFYPIANLNELMKRDPMLSKWLLDYTSHQMQTSVLRLTRMLGKSARERLQMLLSELVIDHGEKFENSIEVKPQLSREELSSMVGLATETVIRMLAEFKEQGIIHQVGKRMFIHRPDLLAPALRAG